MNTLTQTAGADDPALDQVETIAFLSRPEAFGLTAGAVTHIQTHCAHVFLCGDAALKLKRAVRYDYMDLSTPDRRHAMLRRELELNRPVAPSLYRDVLGVTRGPDRALRFGGTGQAVDWVLRMKRFPAEDELTAIAARGALDDALAIRLGQALAVYHRAAPKRPGPGVAPMRAIVDELDRVFGADAAMRAAVPFAEWHAQALRAVEQGAQRLDLRGQAGLIRRGHGDLHIRNIVMLDGQPVPFDALEFDEALGTCDVLYDLAFLLMDLCHRNLRRAACRVLDAWQLEVDDDETGLALLPLFMSLRAAIRAMVLLQEESATHQPGSRHDTARRYMDLGLSCLSPPAPVCLAIGGYSGAGKSHLARALAPLVGAAPGALWLASDAQRKAGGAVGRRLPQADYTQAARDHIYAILLQRADRALRAGHAVILDATFLDPVQRKAARAMAERVGVPFVGLWLDAPTEVLRARVAARQPGLSDADLSVLQRQLAAGMRTDWTRIDAATPPEQTLAAALRALPRHG